MPKLLLASLAGLLVFTGAGCLSGYSVNVERKDNSEELVDSEESEYTIPDGVETDVDVPLRASIGESFQVVATVTNSSNRDQILHSIDMDADYLEGVAVVSTVPEFSESFLLEDGTMTHFFEEAIPAGETTTVTFNMEAVATGDYNGDFDVCFDDGLSCTFLQIRTIVE